MNINPDLLRAIVLKVSFKPEALRRAQAALLYVALSGNEFTADCLPGEIVGEDTTLAGCAVGSLATMKLIERCGRCKSPSPTRNGAWVNIWKLASFKKATAETWLKRNGFPIKEQPQAELFAYSYERAHKNHTTESQAAQD